MSKWHTIKLGFKELTESGIVKIKGQSKWKDQHQSELSESVAI